MSEMTVNSLQVQCDNEAAALERLLRVVRFRGFSILKFSAVLDAAAEFLNIHLTVSSDRSLHLLENQLKKNVEVKNVWIESEARHGEQA